MRTASGALRAISLLPLVFLIASCGSKQASWKDKVAACSNVAPEQKGTFMAPLPGTVQILVDNQFTDSQISEIQAMADQWNQLGQKLSGQDFFTVQTADVPDALRTQNFQSCAVDVGTGAGAFYLVNEAYTIQNVSPTQWSDMHFGPNIPGATVRCYLNDDFDKQVMMIRPDLIGANQFGDVVLHELGHAIGLDHSCKNGAGSPDFVSCSGLPSGSPYQSAIMYPTLTLGSSSALTAGSALLLQANDTARTSCLY